MSSNVGNSQVYEAGDQRVPPDSQKAENQAEPYEEGKKNSHKDNDSSKSTSASSCSLLHVILHILTFISEDERSIANRLAAASDQNDSSSGKGDAESRAAQQDATLPAKMHGNEPSKGAKIDAEIQAEEEAMLAKKDAAKAASKKN